MDHFPSYSEHQNIWNHHVGKHVNGESCGNLPAWFAANHLRLDWRLDEVYTSPFQRETFKEFGLRRWNRKIDKLEVQFHGFMVLCHPFIHPFIHPYIHLSIHVSIAFFFGCLHIAKPPGKNKNSALQSVCAPQKTARFLSSVGALGLKYDVQNHKLVPSLKNIAPEK